MGSRGRGKTPVKSGAKTPVSIHLQLTNAFWTRKRVPMATNVVLVVLVVA